MMSNRYRTVAIGVIVLLLIASLFIPSVYADSHDTADTGRSYQIVQGEQVVSVEPFEGSGSVESFYGYHHPYVGSRDNPRWGRSFSSEGTVDYQQDDTSILMLYDGPGGVSFVAVHDKYHKTASDGTTGGSVSWRLSGLPDGGEWAVIDDEYGWLTTNETQDDVFLFDPAHEAGAPGTEGQPPGDSDALLSWVWITGRNDGVAYRGLESNASIRIDPAFNEDSYHRYGDRRRADVPPDDPDQGERYNGTVDDWQVIVPSEDEDFERISLDELDEPVEIRSSSAPARPVSVTLENETLDPGESARLSATIENPGDVVWAYEAGFYVGDTEVQSETVTVPPGEERTVEFTQEFDSAGTYNLAVGNERTTLTVGDPSATDDGAVGSDNTGDNTPGFGPIIAMIALLIVAVATLYRTQ